MQVWSIRVRSRLADVLRGEELQAALCNKIELRLEKIDVLLLVVHQSLEQIARHIITHTMPTTSWRSASTRDLSPLSTIIRFTGSVPKAPTDQPRLSRSLRPKKRTPPRSNEMVEIAPFSHMTNLSNRRTFCLHTA